MPRKNESQKKPKATKPRVSKASKRVPEVLPSLKLEFRRVGGNFALDITASGGVTLTGAPSSHPTRKVPVVSYIQFDKIGTNKGEFHSTLELIDLPGELLGKGQ